jgi:hypothetical protein
LQYWKKFLEKIFEHEKYMFKYKGESIDQICLELPKREKKRVFVVHDEYIFYSNNGKCRL